MTRTRVVAVAALALAALALAAAPADAQRAGAVRGAVRDSLGDRPLAGATIQLAPAANLRAVRTTVADSLGRFAFDTVVAGPHVIGFVHPDVVALGIDMPVRALDVAPGAVATVELALAGGATLRRALCGVASDSAAGAVSGVVRDASTGYPLDAVSVTLSWRDLRVERGRVVVAPRRLAARTGVGGVYLICGAPSGVEVTLRAAGRVASARASDDIAVTVPPRSLLRQDVLLADEAAAADARLTGTVRDERGRPIGGALVSLVGVAAAATTASGGTFRLDGLPRGTRTLEARAVGYSPARVAVALTAHAPATVDVALERRAPSLAPVVVRDRARRTWLDLEGFNTRRSRHIGGAFLTQEDLDRRRGHFATDAVHGVRGLQVQPSGNGAARVLRGRGGCRPDVYVNGTYVRGAADEIDHLLGPNDLMAVEVYSGPGDTPAEFVPPFGGGCGAVVLWTKR